MGGDDKIHGIEITHVWFDELTEDLMPWQLEALDKQFGDGVKPAPVEELRPPHWGMF